MALDELLGPPYTPMVLMLFSHSFGQAEATVRQGQLDLEGAMESREEESLLGISFIRLNPRSHSHTLSRIRIGGLALDELWGLRRRVLTCNPQPQP